MHKQIPIKHSLNCTSSNCCMVTRIFFFFAPFARWLKFESLCSFVRFFCLTSTDAFYCSARDALCIFIVDVYREKRIKFKTAKLHFMQNRIIINLYSFESRCVTNTQLFTAIAQINFILSNRS